jgi:drug/metabolite transporter (DMT)-like permease
LETYGKITIVVTTILRTLSSVTFLKLETFSDELIWPDSKVIYPTEWSSYLKIVTLGRHDSITHTVLRLFGTLSETEHHVVPMSWFFIALSCALFTACSDAVSKRLMQDLDEWVTGTLMLGVSIPIVLPIFLAQELKPVSTELVVILAVALPLEILGYYLFLTAIRMAPLSLTVPFLAFTPVFTIFTSALLVNERISLTGGVGISLVTVGAYILHGDVVRQGVLAPLRAVLSNRGSKRMLLVSLIWSVTSALGKKGVTIYGAIPFGFLLLLLIAMAFLLVTCARVRAGKTEFDAGKIAPGLLIVGGIFMASAEIAHFVSLSMASVSYMIAVKRLSLLFGVILGWFFFKERNIRYRLVGAALMVSGVFFLYE